MPTQYIFIKIVLVLCDKERDKDKSYLIIDHEASAVYA